MLCCSPVMSCFNFAAEVSNLKSGHELLHVLVHLKGRAYCAYPAEVVIYLDTSALG